MEWRESEEREEDPPSCYSERGSRVGCVDGKVSEKELARMNERIKKVRNRKSQCKRTSE